MRYRTGVVARIATVTLVFVLDPALAREGDRTPGGVPLHELRTADGTVLRYALVVPEGASEGDALPAVLAFPPGPQNAAMVDAALDRYFGGLAEAGFVVVVPEAPGGMLFFRGAERHVPALLDAVAQRFAVEGGRFHLAGPSNGGRSAFRAAGLYPERFHSIAALPGFPPESEDMDRLDRLHGMPVALFVGGEDRGWLERMRRAEERLRALGHPVVFEVFEGEGHVPPSLTGARVAGILARHRELARASASGGDGGARRDAGGARDAPDAPRAKIARVLDALHRAAAEADEATYFALFAPDAVFFGTDPGERWTIDEFRRWALPYFERDSAWTYTVRERHVFAPGESDVAWFDEIVVSAHYGACRGTGVLRRIDGDWKIEQYHLTIPVPNELAEDFVRRIRGESPAATTVLLVRHAEKDERAGPDPPLLPQGGERAKRLAAMLSRVDLVAIYATPTRRTQATARPVAEAAGLEITTTGEPATELAKRLRAHRGGTVLVVGHSNTLPEILRALGAGDHSVEGYENLFVVTLAGPGPPEVLRLRF